MFSFSISPSVSGSVAFLSPSVAPLIDVIVISVIVGFLMVIVFRYTSDQKAIRRAKDRLKANLLAVRLFQDQLSVVLRSYVRILRATGGYLRLAFTPFLIVSIPILFLIVQLDRYLGWMPVETHRAFLLEAQLDNSANLDGIVLQLPPELVSTAPAVHVPAENMIAWRVVANREGRYKVAIVADGQASSKQVVVSGGVSRISPVRLRGTFWARMFESGESALAPSGPIRSISINYPSREITFLGGQWNWIALFFVLSLVAGFFFKTVFGIQI